MIPIRDQLGRVIAFTGRVLRDDQPGGKYVNSPETMLFHKSRVLFALDKARRFIVDERRAIVCEGQIDAIRCHQAGIQTVVASQGTALTADHARLLKRYADAVVFVLDPDEAGENAALRSAEHFLQAGLGLYAVTLPEGTDPDTMICNEGPDAFRALVEKAESIVEFTVSVMRRREDINTETGLMRASRAVLEIVRHTPSAVRRDQYLQAAADKLGLREQALREDLRRLTQPRRRKPREEPADPEREHTVRPPEEIALLETLIAHPEQSALIKEYLPLSTFRDPDCRQLVELLLEHEDDPDFNLTTATTEDGALVRLAARVQAEPRAIHDGDMTPEKAVQDMILVMRRKALEREREALRKRMRTAGEEEQKQLRVQCTQIVYDMNRFKQGWEEALPLLEL